MSPAAELQRKLEHEFAEPNLLVQALTHRSFGSPHNERLEFLGDSILNFVIADELYRQFPKLREGELSRLRASLVREQALFELAQKLALGDALRLGEGELRSGGVTRPSILADAVEALVGAIFLDAGFETARGVIRGLYRDHLVALDPSQSRKDPKTLLQELLQAQHLPLPSYEVVATHGAAHSQTFEVDCVVERLGIRASGSGTSRRLAEQDAARRALAQVGR